MTMKYNFDAGDYKPLSTKYADSGKNMITFN